MPKKDNPDWVVGQLGGLVRSAFQTHSASVFPTVLLSLGEEKRRAAQTGGTMADVGLAYLSWLGLRCDRTRMNLGGYPSILRDLSDTAPWKVTPDDVEEPLSEERAAELRPLYVLANEIEPNDLMSSFHEERERRSRWSSVVDSPPNPMVGEYADEAFKEQLELARCIGVSDFPAVFDATFDFGEFSLSPGLPDLLAWSDSCDPPLWFFAEVKGPKDSLRRSQSTWLRAEWEKIGGRFVLLVIH